MLYLNEFYLNREDFKKRIEGAINDLLYRALGAEKLGDVIYDDIVAMCFLNMQDNIRKIKTEIESGDIHNKLQWFEQKHLNEMNQLKVQVNLLQAEVENLTHSLHLLSKKT